MNNFQKLLKNYQRKLTNLSGSNKSLLQLRLSVSQDVDLDAFDYLNNTPSFDILTDLVERKQSITLCKELDPRDTKTNEASKRLRGIQRKDKFIFDERGAKDLYIGWPYVEGKLNDGTPVRCPLIYFPVELDLTNEEWRLKIRKDISISFNKTFLLAYSYFNEIKLEEEFLDFNFSDFEKDLILFRTKLYELLKDSPIDINFNQDLFSNRIEKFVDFRKEDFLHSYENGIVKLQPYAVLGIFPQASSYLIPDYDHLVKTSSYQNLEELFLNKTFTEEKAQTNFSYDYLTKIKEEHIITPLTIDASQENALKALKEGHSLVVQGPPGTGKSQLICNIASDYIARGKRVLVVCQKRVALDVVYQRLKEIDLAPFSALVHDFKADRANLYKQINEQIEHIDDYESKNNGYNSIQLERDFSQTSRQIDHLLEQLEGFREALFNDQEYGLSIKFLYLNSDRKNAKLDLTQQYRKFNHENEQLFEKRLGRLFTFQQTFSENHPWYQRVNFAAFELIDQENILKLIKEIPLVVKKFEEELTQIFGHSIRFNEAIELLNKESLLKDILSLLSHPSVFRIFQVASKFPPDKNWLEIQEQQINELYRDIGVETSLPQSELGNFLGILQEGNEARNQPFKKIWWTLFNKDKYYIKRIIVENKLPWSNKGFKRLIQKLDNRLNLEHKLSLFNEKEWLIDIPKHPNKDSLEHWMHDNFQAIESLELVSELKQHRNLFGFNELSYDKIAERIHTFKTLTTEFKNTFDYWKSYFTNSQINTLIDDQAYNDAAFDSITDEFDNLCLYDQLQTKLSKTQLGIVDKLNEFTEVKPTQKINIFKDSNRLAWINHLEKKYPVLKIVSTDEIAHIEEELRELIAKKSTISKDILLLKVREQTYQNLEYNRLKNRVTYRELQHQVTKKRRIWPLRKTLAEYYDDVFNLIPCWLASPEAVSSIFPLEKIFDLVIFDEASQCFAEKSIPALERGRQLVISGDEQQLSPNDLYQVRWDEENDDLFEIEKDSLLDLAAQYLPQVMLKGHYRSKYLELIDFSNRHFYKNKLQLLPYATNLDTHIPPINYVYLEDGIWENNANVVEANKVIELVEESLNQGKNSIGIVTFNFKQQTLIEDLLDQLAREKKIVLPEELFVKNIENVQGDEREHIIFSIGYAKNKLGRLVMNFGTLNQEHGQKRLNVAITRAKSKATIVTSILPHELNTDEAKHDGPKLFKAYLAYCLNVSNGDFHFEQDFGDKPKQKLLKTLIENRIRTEVKVSKIPFADLRIHSKSNELILTDDEHYYNAISCKGAHITTPQLLEERNWNTSRIYSRNFWLNREKFYMNLKNK